MGRHARTTLVLLLAAAALVGGGSAAQAQATSDIVVDSPVRALEISPTKTRADLDVNLKNTATARRIVSLSLEGIPDGWTVGIWNRFFDFQISEIVVEPATEDTPFQRTRLRVELPEDPRPEPGDYSFTLHVKSQDGRITYESAAFSFILPPAAEEEEEERQVTLRSSFPFLRGPASSQYEFEIVIRNETGEERSFTLSANVVGEDNEPQQDWDISFKPAFGEEKIISSVSVPDNLSENVDVRVTPPRFALPGNYLIPVEVISEDEVYQASGALQLTIRGRGELLLTTTTGRLNINATAGDPTNAVTRLTNIGTGDLLDIDFLADAPEGWELKWDFTSYPKLEPNFQIDAPLTITPPGDAVPGDYLLTLRVRNADSTDSLDLRVTVAQSTIWGWLGIVLVLAVLGGLVGLVWRLGRR